MLLILSVYFVVSTFTRSKKDLVTCKSVVKERNPVHEGT
jgi:hypothetical protein